MPDPNLASTLPPNPDLNQPMPNPAPQPANLPQPGLRSIIPASWSGGFLPQRQMAPQIPPPQPVNINPITGNPYNPARRADLAPEERARLDQPGPSEVDPSEIRSTAETNPDLQPPPFRRPYLPAQERPFGQIGSVPWNISGAINYPGAYAGPGMPAPGVEAYSIMGRSGGMLSRTGPAASSPYYSRASGLAMQLAPIMDMISKGKFSKYYLQEKQGQIQLMQDEMLLNMQQGLMAHQRDLMQFDNVLNAYNLGGFDKDPVKNEQIATQRLEELTQGNKIANDILHNQGIHALESYIKAQDREFRNAYSGWVSAQKSRNDSARESGLTGGGAGIASRPEIFHPKATPTAPGTEAAAGESDMQARQEKVENEIAQAHGGLNPSAMKDARDLFEGTADTREMSKRWDPETVTAIHDAAADIDNRVRKALTSHKNRDDKAKDIEEVSPERAETLRGLATYQIGPTEVSKRKDRQEHLVAQARLLDPNYKPDQFAVIHDIVKKAELPLIANQQLDSAGNELLKALRPFSEGERMPARWYDQAMAAGWSGDPKYKVLGQALTAYAQAVSRSESGQGRPYVGIVRQMLQHLDTTASPAAIRGQLQVDNNIGFSLADSFNRSFKQYTGSNENIPGWRQDIADSMAAKQSMIAATGEMPDWAPDNLKALSRKPSDKDRPSWRGPEQERPPLTRDDISTLQRIMKDPNASETQRQRAREALSKGGAL